MNKIITWKELADKISLMSEEDKQQPVRLWGDYAPLGSACDLDKTDEKMYRIEDIDCAYPESMLDDDLKKDCELICDKGTYYIITE